ncbi:MAG: mycofactocin biosynthesis peptidyl-dipeptidase MftE [Actinomycetota bacterium]
MSEQTWPEAEAGPDTLLVPLGSTEQHGPHLPLATDTLIAAHWCARAARRRTDLAVAPALPYGASGEHQGFPGTLSIGTEALTAVLIELGRSALPPYRRLVLVNGHGGNAEALGAAVALLRREGRAVEAVWPRLDGDAHAGRTETALLLAALPHLVRGDRAEPGTTTPLTELLPRLRAEGVAAVAPNGILGDPTGATADEGDALWVRLDDQLDQVLDQALDRPHEGPSGR